MKRIINSIVSFAMVISIILVNAGIADASTSRVAKISNMEGTIEIQKSGGKRIIIGYKDMSLHEGDILSTGSNSSAVLNFSNGTAEDDTLILESNTTVTFSKLSNKSGTITKINLKKGKAWVDVKSIKQQQDQFEFVTPTANMSVRGTNFFVGVDPNTAQSIIAMFSGVVNYRPTDNNLNDSKTVYPAQVFYNDSTEGGIVGMMSNESIAQLLANTSSETMNAIIQNFNKIQQENEALLELLRVSNSNMVDSNLSDEVLKTNIERIVYALLQEAKNKNLINDTQYLETIEELQKNSTNQGQQPQTNLETNGKNNDSYDFILQQKTQQMQDRLNQQANLQQANENKLAELKRKQQELEEQRQQELEKKQQEALEKMLSRMTPEQREAYLARNRELQGTQQQQQQQGPIADSTVPSTPPTPVPTPEPTPEPTVSWNDYTLPLQLQLVESGNTSELNVIYDETSGSYQFAQPMSVKKGAILQIKPKFLDALEVIEVKANDKNVEMNLETKSYNIEVGTVPTAFRIIYKVKHAQLGERSFEMNLNLHKKTIGWNNVEQPIKISYDYNTIAKEISYQFAKHEEAGLWSGNMLGNEVHSVKGPTTIQLTALEGFTISEVEYNGKLTTGDTITIAKPNGQTEVLVKLKLAHDEFGDIRVKILMNFINENEVPFQIFKVNNSLETNEYEEVILDSQNYLPREVNELNTLTYYVKPRETVEIVGLYKYYSPEEVDPTQLESDSEGRYLIPVIDEDWVILNGGGRIYYELKIKDPQTLEEKSIVFILMMRNS